MSCVSNVFIAISFILGIAGSVMGVVALWKIYDGTGDTPWCDICREMYPNDLDKCNDVCETN